MIPKPLHVHHFLLQAMLAIRPGLEEMREPLWRQIHVQVLADQSLPDMPTKMGKICFLFAEHGLFLDFACTQLAYWTIPFESLLTLFNLECFEVRGHHS